MVKSEREKLIIKCREKAANDFGYHTYEEAKIKMPRDHVFGIFYHAMLLMYDSLNKDQIKKKEGVG